MHIERLREYHYHINIEEELLCKLQINFRTYVELMALLAKLMVSHDLNPLIRDCRQAIAWSGFG